MRIGVIADTHGLLRPEAIEALQGAELLLHAGDLHKPEVHLHTVVVGDADPPPGNRAAGVFSNAAGEDSARLAPPSRSRAER